MFRGSSVAVEQWKWTNFLVPACGIFPALGYSCSGRSIIFLAATPQEAFCAMFFLFGVLSESLSCRPTMIKYGINNIRDLVGPKVNLQMIYDNPICRLEKHQ
ncbi:unnamed protein product [Darwinula stevensoni]|uniref:Uncharacterized protein n=1 Tax=Darwinula stevensoni TaxID=69355 RepID=A0A7R9A9Q6_9CRUS|nr:unnamed protein product [Darwinula stevensoni]CAG0897615.1 unnamed protein product [Darwinula stevensoni]